MTRKKRSIDVQRTKWLSFRQLWTPKQTIRANNDIYVPSSYSFGSIKDDPSPKYHRDLRNREKLQTRNLPRRDRKFSNIYVQFTISSVKKSRCSYRVWLITQHLHLDQGN